MQTFWSLTAVVCLFAMVFILTRRYRSLEVKHEFQRQHPCPSTGRSTGACPGYVKDHIRALACGGPDAGSNMQWQTTAAAKAKDKWETRGCRR